MKKLFFIATFIAASFAVQAQDEAQPLAFSIGLEAALPMSNLSDIASFGIGGSAQVDYTIAPTLALTLNAGYINMSFKDVVGGGSIGYIPVLGGIKYAFTEQLYGSAQLGATFYSKSGGGTSFTYAPGIGYKFSPNFDALLKYTGWSQKDVEESALGLRVAYTF
jgi:hypothetical protein